MARILSRSRFQRHLLLPFIRPSPKARYEQVLAMRPRLFSMMYCFMMYLFAFSNNNLLPQAAYGSNSKYSRAYEIFYRLNLPPRRVAADYQLSTTTAMAFNALISISSAQPPTAVNAVIAQFSFRAPLLMQHSRVDICGGFGAAVSWARRLDGQPTPMVSCIPAADSPATDTAGCRPDSGARRRDILLSAGRGGERRSRQYHHHERGTPGRRAHESEQIRRRSNCAAGRI